jgi:hypothetical protein
MEKQLKQEKNIPGTRQTCLRPWLFITCPLFVVPSFVEPTRTRTSTRQPVIRLIGVPCWSYSTRARRSLLLLGRRLLIGSQLVPKKVVSRFQI